MRISFALVCISAIIPAHEHHVAAIRLPRAGSNSGGSPQLQHLPQAETTSNSVSNSYTESYTESVSECVSDALASAKSTAEQWAHQCMMVW